MNLIASADKNWGIGKDNQLLVRIPEDMKFFRRMTTGKVVVMGRKTLESFPNGEPLKDRVNIVLTRDLSYEKKGAVAVHTLEELKAELKKYNPQDIFVIGGESIYRQLLKDCDTAYITRLDFAYDADTHLPNLDELGDWQLASESEEQTYFDLIYHFNVYRRV